MTKTDNSPIRSNIDDVANDVNATNRANAGSRIEHLGDVNTENPPKGDFCDVKNHAIKGPHIEHLGSDVKKRASRPDDVNPEVFTALDLEMNQPSGKIIQIGTCTGNLITGTVLERLRIYVRIDEPISDHITALTNITQAQHDSQGVWLPDAYTRIAESHARHNAHPNALTWGGDDTNYLQERLLDAVLRSKGLGFWCPLSNHEKLDQLGYPWVYGRSGINLKVIWQFYAMAGGIKMRGGLAKSLTRVKMAFDGTKHDACDDAYNTFRLAHKLVSDMGRMFTPAQTLGEAES